MARNLPVHRQIPIYNGSPQYLESITTSGSSQKNATAFTPGDCIMVTCTEDFYYIAGSSTVSVSSTNGVPCKADEHYYVTLQDVASGSPETYIAVIQQSGAGTLKFYKMK
jgi:hypothetical protein